MTLAELWGLIRTGGVPATLLIVVALFLREDIVAGKAYRREIDRAEKLNAQAGETVMLSKRMLDVIDQYTRQGGGR